MSDGLPHNAPRRMLELDSLRGVAALAVVLYHSTNRFNELFGHSTPIGIDFRYGECGVDLFFMLSGFVICMSLQRTQRLTDFVVNRFSRLYPTYWAAIGVAFAVVATCGLPSQQVTLCDAAVNLTMLQGLLDTPHVDGVYWSMQVELFFYATIVCLYFGRAFRRLMTAVTVWLLVSLVVHAIGLWLASDEAWLYSWLVRLQTAGNLLHVQLFAVGIVFYDITKMGRFQRRHCACLAVCLVVHCCLTTTPDVLIAVGLASVLYLAVTGRIPLLAARPLVFLGSISYPLYLLHQNVGNVVLRALGRLGCEAHAAVLSAVGVSIALATGLMLVIERPALRVIRNWWQRGPAAGTWNGARHAA